jgi:hypothetical protein
MYGASGERPGGKTKRIYGSQWRQYVFETFNQNNVSCHSTVVIACNMNTCQRGPRWSASVESCLTLENRSEPLFPKVGISRSIDKDDATPKKVGWQGVHLYSNGSFRKDG